MSDAEATILRMVDSRSFMEGPEHCREYVRNKTLWFGTSTVPPGQRGAIDRGHAASVEVFFCVAGHVLIYDESRHYELLAGDALLIPEALPHTIINIGDVAATIVWAGAPGE